MQRVYGDLATPELLEGTCAFRAFGSNRDASEVQRRALRALGELQAPCGERKAREEEEPGGKGTGDKGKKGGSKGGGKEDTGETVPGRVPGI